MLIYSVKCFDIKDEFLGEYNLGNIFEIKAIQEKLLLHYQHYLRRKLILSILLVGTFLPQKSG